jgi:lysophospholipid acyltransferase (LPLAT)-like uncharacterized protein
MPEKSDQIQQAYKIQPLSRYSLKERMLIRTVGMALYLVVSAIGKTLKYEVEGLENFEIIGADGKIPIYTFWHNRIFAGTYFFRNRGIVVMSSLSFDGEYTGRFIKRMGFGTVRGSSTRGAISAIIEMIRLMKKGVPTAFSIDGPKGPKYVAKLGACLLAKKTGNPMMPFVVECEKYWEIKSWDRLQIPKPFSRVKVIIEKPIYLAADAGDTEIEASRAELETRLNELVKRGENWRKNKS